MKIETRSLENKIASQAMTYKEVARIAGITEKTLQAARNGSEIRAATAGRFAAALGVPIDELISD